MKRIQFCLLSLAALLAGPAHAQAAEAVAREMPQEVRTAHDCPAAAPVRIQAGSPADAQVVCEGARRALDFLAQAGLELPRETSIEIVERLPGDMDGKAVGCYIPATRRVLLLSFQAFESVGTWFRMPVDPELYRSAAAHEVAHAMVGCNSPPGRLPVAAHEYVAYVAMFATMEPRVRQRVLALFPGRGLVNSAQIQPFVYLMDPLQFAVDAWRHYLRQANKAAWLRDIVAGRVVEEWPSEGP